MQTNKKYVHWYLEVEIYILHNKFTSYITNCHLKLNILLDEHTRVISLIARQQKLASISVYRKS